VTELPIADRRLPNEGNKHAAFQIGNWQSQIGNPP
jgi:hypothetical protein